MYHRQRLMLLAILFSVWIINALALGTPLPRAFAATKPELALNLQQGPLGVALVLKGKNFPPGQVALTYIDAHAVPGTFVAPSDSSVQSQVNGTFSTTNLILPSSGPAGIWKIIATDSLGAIWSVSYLVLAAPGEQQAGAPTLTINPTSGVGGDVIAFSGTNWLPEKTVVNLTLLGGTTLLPLLDTPPTSDKNGTITGAFHLPANLQASQVTVLASDSTSGDLRSQAQVTIVNASPTPTGSPTVTASPIVTQTPTGVSTSTPTQAVTVTITSAKTLPQIPCMGHHLPWSVRVGDWHS
ncbi:MAG: hypothetical protein ACJ788_16320 [Ktedonobacteraceae bacterium]